MRWQKCFFPWKPQIFRLYTFLSLRSFLRKVWLCFLRFSHFSNEQIVMKSKWDIFSQTTTKNVVFGLYLLIVTLLLTKLWLLIYFWPLDLLQLIIAYSVLPLSGHTYLTVRMWNQELYEILNHFRDCMKSFYSKYSLVRNRICVAKSFLITGFPYVGIRCSRENEYCINKQREGVFLPEYTSLCWRWKKDERKHVFNQLFSRYKSRVLLFFFTKYSLVLK